MANIEDLDSKHKALLALVAATEAFFVATCEALEQKYPGRGAQDRAMIEAGTAHLCVSIQAGSGRVEASLALVEPEFSKTLEAPELTLRASIASIFANPEDLKIVNLGQLH